MDLLCELPYRCASIDEEGEVRPCCPEYCRFFSFGNILKTPFSEIWNGDRAKQFRKQFILNEYKYCNLNLCLPHRSDDEIQISEISQQRPASVLLGYDRTCNVKCIFCTPKPQNHIRKFENYDKWLPDLFKDVKQVNIACGGEALFSPHSRKLIKKIAQLYPQIKFDLLTNGLLFNEENLKELQIYDKLSTVGISFHAMKGETYNKLVKNSDFDKVMENVKYAVSLKAKNIIKTLEFRFVITAYNYKEMADFARFAKTSGALAVFMSCIKYNMTENLYKEINISDFNHPKYNDFIKVLKNPIFKEKFVIINQELFKLKPKNLISALFHNR